MIDVDVGVDAGLMYMVMILIMHDKPHLPVMVRPLILFTGTECPVSN